MTLGGLEHTQPRVATLIVDRTTRQGAQGETEGDEHDEAGEHSGGECSGEGAVLTEQPSCRGEQAADLSTAIAAMKLIER